MSRRACLLVLLCGLAAPAAAAPSWDALVNQAILDVRGARPLLRRIGAGEGATLDALEEAFVQAAETGAAGAVKIMISPTNSGSGFLVETPKGPLLVTNAHVAGRAGALVKVLHGSEAPMAGLVLGVNRLYDLALVELQSPCRTCSALSAAAEPPRVGRFAIVVGAPLGLEGTVTVGHVSHVGRRYGSGLVDDYIQIDAAVNPGNSGGPLLDLHGRVTGVVSSIISPGSGLSAGIALAIPYRHVQRLIDRYVATGAIAAGELEATIGIDRVTGELFVQKAPAAAGLRDGDALLALDGSPLAGFQYVDLIRAVADKVPGQTVAFQVRRDGQTLDVPVRLKGD